MGAEKSRDLIKLDKEKMSEKLSVAMKSENTEEAAKAMTEFADMIQQSIISEARALNAESAADKSILAARGVRQLTSTEQKYFEQAIEAMKGDNVKQALTNIEVAMPITYIDSVFDELVQEHPLLAAITFVNTSGSVKMIVNKGGIQLAVWGKLTDSYKTELSGSIEEIDAGLYKLQAFIPVAKAMLDLGPAWLDKYIRTILSEALFFGIEKAIISGTGKDEPIGINRVVGSTSSVSAGVYSEKEAIKVTSFEPASYGALCSRLATNSESGLSRTVTGLILIVNPVDYLKVIMPATTMLTPSAHMCVTFSLCPHRLSSHRNAHRARHISEWQSATSWLWGLQKTARSSMMTACSLWRTTVYMPSRCTATVCPLTTTASSPLTFRNSSLSDTMLPRLPRPLTS